MSAIFRPTKIEWISFWVLMPIISIATGLVMFKQRFYQEWEVMLGAFTAIYLIGLLSWYLHIVSMHYLAKLLPKLSQTIIRLVLLAIVHMALITLTMCSYFYGFDALSLFGYRFDEDSFRTGLWVGVFLTLIATSLWQVEYIFKQWRLSLSEKELIEQQKLVHEFENLKKQINPHFLFNNLNILSSLIAEDAIKAEYFLNELSKVYRYLLKNTEDGLTSVGDELDFIGSYYELLRIRHGEAIRLVLEVDDAARGCYLPPYSLQLLVENAVKHNVATRTRPLQIHIYTKEGNLQVVNNLQKKKGNILSNKVGLSNITENYKLLMDKDPQFYETENEFVVILPLIKIEIN